ncbi:MAG: hypothetical protein ACYTGZ_14910 [Planctomycetota bacterium]
MDAAPLTTAEIVALRGLNRRIDGRWIAWAIDQLQPGRDMPALAELAGAVEPLNYFEASSIVDRALNELGVEPYESEEDAAIAYASTCARNIVDGAAPIGPTLAELGKLYNKLDLLRELQDFWLLGLAHEDLQRYPDQHKWPDATRENIDDVVIGYCCEWLSSHPVRCGHAR